MLLPYIVAGLVFVGASRAATIQISVGANNAFAFVPPSVTAAVGDTILFTFESGAHSVTQSTFAIPCTQSGNISSPFFPVTPGATGNLPTFSFVVNTTAPIWLHCAQVGHCPNGMVAAVNAPTTGDTYALFQQIAEGKATAPSPASTTAASATSASTTAASTTSAAPTTPATSAKPATTTSPTTPAASPSGSSTGTGTSSPSASTTAKSGAALNRDLSGIAALLVSLASAVFGLI